jgi:hypothetical protein
MTSSIVAKTCSLLAEAEAKVKCSDLRSHLEELGFKVRDGKRAGHKIVTHPNLKDFYSTSYACGHGRNSVIKPAYIRNIIKTLKIHEQALIDYLQKVGENESP